MEREDFLCFLNALRAGETWAGDELARRFGPCILRVAGMRLKTFSVKRVLNPSDVRQSVLGRFLAGVRAGKFDLETPQQLEAMLIRMATNLISTKQRRTAREQGTLPAAHDPVDLTPSPREHLERAELAAKARAHLSPEEWTLFEAHYLQDRGWNAIAAEKGGSPDQLRMRLLRALARARNAMRQEEIGDVH